MLNLMQETLTNKSHFFYENNFYKLRIIAKLSGYKPPEGDGALAVAGP